jgi:hypothetical protein
MPAERGGSQTCTPSWTKKKGNIQKIKRVSKCASVLKNLGQVLKIVLNDLNINLQTNFRPPQAWKNPGSTCGHYQTKVN